MNYSLTLFHLFGIPFRINYSWLIIFGLVLTSMALYQFPVTYPHWSPLEQWLIAGVTTLLFFTSVVLHELSHSLLALRNGIPVKSITLFIFGGMAHIAKEAERPRVEAVIALAGPISSLLIGAAFALLAYFVGPLNEQVEAVATTLAIINVMLAVFNLLPGFPLDGGRVLRALLWAITGNYMKATRISTTIGRMVAYTMIAGGAALVFFGYWRNGIWLMFIGLFLNTAAVASYRQSLQREALRRYQIGDLMVPLTEAVAVAEGAPFIEASADATGVMEYMEEKDLQQALVVRDGRVVGIVNPGVFRSLDDR